MGFLSPFIIRCKILMQDLWALGLEWDDGLPPELEEKARRWFTEMPKLADVKVPRCLRLDQTETITEIQIHAFGDASQDAYGAVIYMRTVYSSGRVAVRLVESKSNVAPPVSTSIPRLEMMAAIINLQLTQSILPVLGVAMGQVTFWSDSLNVLYWIRNRSRRLKIFIAYRVGEIQSSTEPKQWRYVPTSQNPADLPSRGVVADKLVDSSLWWNGPGFLEQEPENWPKNRVEKSETADQEVKTSELGYLTVGQDGAKNADPKLDPSNFSNWMRLVRVNAWVNRFLDNCSLVPHCRVKGELKPDEVQLAEKALIRDAQREAFAEEYRAQQHKRELPETSKILSLQPKLYEDCLIRCGGRIEYAERHCHMVQDIPYFCHGRELPQS
ncbi:uncharacterized protein LOC135493627 [Lineus longissimus]|uniref:uncharacterized protein LOC135493627 n=1 Tax=Lineus longissimus TaxID=88925 RepID=UPI002B4D6C22